MATENGQQPATAPLPPHDLDAEESLLGALMFAGGGPILERVRRTGLQPGDFYRGSHGHVYRAIERLAAAGDPYDAVTVADELARTGQLADVGGKQRIHELNTIAPATFPAPRWAKIVVDYAKSRRAAHIGEQIIRRAWEGLEDADQVIADARQALEEVIERGASADLHVETWHQFESQAHDQIPVLVDRLWPEAAFGFIAAPPKKGKTWVALALAVAVASGRPFLGEYQVPAARPVLYVALEGHRAALRARVGAIARGMGIDPDSDQLDLLHWLYKPPGMNLADPAWAYRLKRAADQIDAALVVVDVLRAGARIKENDQAEFTSLRFNLQPINDAGRSLALLHHNIKLSEISRERDPGERMSGSGAMYGALDAAIYITGSEDHATRLRLDFDLRDLATPDTIHVHLTGERNDQGGYGYRDTAAFQITEDQVDEDDFKKAPPQEIYDYIADQGGTVETTDVRAYFEISGDTLTRRIGRLAALGVEYTGGKGKAGRFTIPKAPEPPPPNLLDPPTLDAPQDAAQPEKPHAATQSRAATEPHNHAGLREEAASTRTDPVRQPESGDLQGKQKPQGAAPYGRASMPAATGSPESNGRAALREAEAWIDDTGFTRTPDQITETLLDHWPTLGAHDHTALRLRAAARAAAEAPEPDAPDEENAGGQ